MQRERRHLEDGSIICENGVLRFRVISENATLGLQLETCTETGIWVPLVCTPPGGDVQYQRANGEVATVAFTSFEPVTVNRQTRGVVLYGEMDEMLVTFTSLLSPWGGWSRHRLQVDKLPAFPLNRLTQSWQLANVFGQPDMCWPTRAIYGAELAAAPAAFVQAGEHFLAMVPDLEDGEVAQWGLQPCTPGDATLTVGFMPTDGAQPLPAGEARFAYSLYLDARALPQRGFQQVVRMLGASDALRLAMIDQSAGPVAALPALPETPDDASWQPFMREGTPAAIAALIGNALAHAKDDEWHMLEYALCWLDRLCLQQRVVEVAGGGPLGMVGNGSAWQAAAMWMPVLLLEAFRLTGISEYASRAIAALAALSADEQACVLAYLCPRYGDVYVNADHEETVALHGAVVRSAVFMGDEVALVLDGMAIEPVVTVVLDGVEPSYTVTVNGEWLGRIPTTDLRAGIEVMLA